MTVDFVVHALLGLLPVICFLTGLVYLDSYRLVALRWVLGIIVVGGVIAGVSYLAHTSLLESLDIGFTSYTRYISPFIEGDAEGHRHIAANSPEPNRLPG